MCSVVCFHFLFMSHFLFHAIMTKTYVKLSRYCQGQTLSGTWQDSQARTYILGQASCYAIVASALLSNIHISKHAEPIFIIVINVKQNYCTEYPNISRELSSTTCVPSGHTGLRCRSRYWIKPISYVQRLQQSS